MKLIEQLYEFMTTQKLSQEHSQLLSDAICALNTASIVTEELETSDQIIHNFIQNMTSDQLLSVATDNYIDRLPAQWAFRSQERKEVIARGKRYFHENGGQQ